MSKVVKTFKGCRDSNGRIKFIGQMNNDRGLSIGHVYRQPTSNSGVYDAYGYESRSSMRFRAVNDQQSNAGLGQTAYHRLGDPIGGINDVQVYTVTLTAPVTINLVTGQISHSGMSGTLPPAYDNMIMRLSMSSYFSYTTWLIASAISATQFSPGSALYDRPIYHVYDQWGVRTDLAWAEDWSTFTSTQPLTMYLYSANIADTNFGGHMPLLGELNYTGDGKIVDAMYLAEAYPYIPNKRYYVQWFNNYVFLDYTPNPTYIYLDHLGSIGITHSNVTPLYDSQNRQCNNYTGHGQYLHEQHHNYGLNWDPEKQLIYTSTALYDLPNYLKPDVDNNYLFGKDWVGGSREIEVTGGTDIYGEQVRPGKYVVYKDPNVSGTYYVHPETGEQVYVSNSYRLKVSGSIHPKPIMNLSLAYWIRSSGEQKYSFISYQGYVIEGRTTLGISGDGVIPGGVGSSWDANNLQQTSVIDSNGVLVNRNNTLERGSLLREMPSCWGPIVANITVTYENDTTLIEADEPVFKSYVWDYRDNVLEKVNDYAIRYSGMLSISDGLQTIRIIRGGLVMPSPGSQTMFYTPGRYENWYSFKHWPALQIYRGFDTTDKDLSGHFPTGDDPNGRLVYKPYILHGHDARKHGFETNKIYEPGLNSYKPASIEVDGTYFEQYISFSSGYESVIVGFMIPESQLAKFIPTKTPIAKAHTSYGTHLLYVDAEVLPGGELLDRTVEDLNVYIPRRTGDAWSEVDDYSKNIKKQVPVGYVFLQLCTHTIEDRDSTSYDKFYGPWPRIPSSEKVRIRLNFQYDSLTAPGIKLTWVGVEELSNVDVVDGQIVGGMPNDWSWKKGYMLQLENDVARAITSDNRLIPPPTVNLSTSAQLFWYPVSERVIGTVMPTYACAALDQLSYQQLDLHFTAPSEGGTTSPYYSSESWSLFPSTLVAVRTTLDILGINPSHSISIQNTVWSGDYGWSAVWWWDSVAQAYKISAKPLKKGVDGTSYKTYDAVEATFTVREDPRRQQDYVQAGMFTLIGKQLKSFVN